MTKVLTTPKLAASILEAGNRKIVLDNNSQVSWINLNNNTCFAFDKNGGGSTYFLENIELFISVPNNAKTIY